MLSKWLTDVFLCLYAAGLSAVSSEAFVKAAPGGLDANIMCNGHMHAMA